MGIYGEIEERVNQPKTRIKIVKEGPEYLKRLEKELERIQNKKKKLEEAEKRVGSKIDQLTKSV